MVCILDIVLLIYHGILLIIVTTRLKTSAEIKVYPSWVVAYTCPDLARYYLSLIPKYYYVKSQMYPAHITIVRKDVETADLTRCGASGIIQIEYSSDIQTNGIYWWLDVWSDDIIQIRRNLGLCDYRLGFDRYHLTIGNCK